MGEKRTSMVIYTGYLEKCRMLSDEQFGILMRALLEYQTTERVPTFNDAVLTMAFEFIKADVDANNQKYAAIVEKRKAAGAKGAAAKKQLLANEANAGKSKQSVANQAVNENEYEYVNENVTANAVTIGPRPEAIDAFEAFWNLYPRKEKQDAAARAWISLNPDAELINTIMVSLRENIARNGSWKRDGGRYIPKADNWLYERRWRDEVREEKDDEPRGKINQFNSFEQRTYTEADYTDLERRKLRRGLG